MKKKNIMLGLAIFAALNAGTYALASDNPFATVPQKTGYYQDVAALVHDGLIDGYADSDFNAKHPLTRYEMAVFTAKAMSKMQSADAADTQRIQKLMKEFQSELTDLHVRVPGVKAKKAGDKKKKSSKGPKIKQAPLNWSLSGQFRFRIDEGYKNTYDTSSSEKKKKDGADGYGGSKNHQIMYQLFNKFNIGGGWKGEIDFIGSKDSHGDKRASGENTDGMCDINKMFVTGPAFGGTTRIGRVKGSLAYKKSLVMGEYYQGIDWVKRVGKGTTALTWGLVDYNTSSLTGDTNRVNDYGDVKYTTSNGKKVTKKAYYYKGERGVGDSDLNPDGLGIKMWQLQHRYQVTPTFGIDVGFWHVNGRHDSYTDYKKAALGRASSDLMAEVDSDIASIQREIDMYTTLSQDASLSDATKKIYKDKAASLTENELKNATKGKADLQKNIDVGNKTTKYKDPNIGEIGFNWQATPKLNIIGHYSQSDWHAPQGGQNKAYSLAFTWGKANASKAHSRQFEFDLVHQERYSAIKGSFDLKSKPGEGQRGFIAEYRYIPVKNVMLDWRWMHPKAINCSKDSRWVGNQYRFQLYYYF